MLFRLTEFKGLNFSDWLNNKDLYIGLIISTLCINLLALVFPIAILQVYDRVIPNKSIETLYSLIVIVFVALIFEMLFKLLRGFVANWVSARFIYKTSTACFKSIIDSSLVQFNRDSASAHLERFNSIQKLEEFVCGQNIILLMEIPFVVIFFILMGVINPIIVIIPFVLIIALFGLYQITHGDTLVKLKGKKDLNDVKHKFIIEMVSSLHTIKSLTMEKQILKRYQRLHHKQINDNYEIIQAMSSINKISNFINQLGTVSVVIVGSILVIEQQLTAGGLASLILLTGRIMQPISKFIIFLSKEEDLLDSASDIEAVLSLQSEENIEQSTHIQSKDIKIKNLSYQYPNTEKWILTNVSISINENECIAIHGKSQSGKTTLLSLLGGLLEITDGSISIGNQSYNSLNPNLLRQQFAFMQQHDEIFQGTIIENLTLFNDNNIEAAKQIAKSIGLHDVIDAMPDGYHTKVGQGTVDTLSKGNKQQVMITRAMINNPGIILFDEANVGMDIASDIKLQKYLTSIKGKKTIVLITHRPSLLAIADTHYALQYGGVQKFNWKNPYA